MPGGAWRPEIRTPVRCHTAWGNYLRGITVSTTSAGQIDPQYKY